MLQFCLSPLQMNVLHTYMTKRTWNPPNSKKWRFATGWTFSIFIISLLFTLCVVFCVGSFIFPFSHRFKSTCIWGKIFWYIITPNSPKMFPQPQPCWLRVAIRFRRDIHLATNVHMFATKVLLLLPEKKHAMQPPGNSRSFLGWKLQKTRPLVVSKKWHPSNRGG